MEWIDDNHLYQSELLPGRLEALVEACDDAFSKLMTCKNIFYIAHRCQLLAEAFQALFRIKSYQ